MAIEAVDLPLRVPPHRGLLGLDRAVLHQPHVELRARAVSDWPKRCKLAYAFLWEYSDQG
jgi:hypothetical protein